MGNAFLANFTVTKFLAHHWFLVALLFVLLVGILAAPQLQEVAEQRLLRAGLVAAVLFVMALPLELSAMGRALLRPGPPLLAVGINFGLLPLFAWLVSLGLSDEMGPGLLVAATTPCTLASAAVWTRRAGGNDAVAILVTIITNSTCFFVTPLWLVTMTGRTVENPEMSLGRMTARLGLLVLLPMVVAQLMRLYRPLARRATAHKMPLSTVAQCGILVMVLLGAIGTGLRIRETTLQAMLLWDLLAMLAAVLTVHLVMLGVGVELAKRFGFSRQDQIAVGFAGSQKTLLVGLLVAVSLQITILPMVTYHICQLVVDTVIAERFRQAAPPEKPVA